uniref:KRIT1/FRMD8 FERM domain-containing protein n=1 Tax=Meloidogyne javanica TaxID=6303 RepID=A0A915MST1_MELJA
MKRGEFPPIRGGIQVYVGLNDWGMSVLNSNSHRQIAAIELNKLEIKFTPNTNFLEVQGEGGCKSADFVATITTPQIGFERIPLQSAIPDIQ